LLADLTHRKHLAVRTAKNVMNATLRAFFRDAVAEKVIEKNPFDELPKKWWPKTVTPEPDPFIEEERDGIIEYFPYEILGKMAAGLCVHLYAVLDRPAPLRGNRSAIQRLRPSHGQSRYYIKPNRRRIGRD
jgi:hypothetical protein